MNGILKKLTQRALDRYLERNAQDIGHVAAILAHIAKRQAKLTALCEAAINAKSVVEIDQNDFTWPIDIRDIRTNMWSVTLRPTKEGHSLELSITGSGNERVLTMLRAALESETEIYDATNFTPPQFLQGFRCMVNGVDETTLYAYNSMITALKSEATPSADTEAQAPLKADD